LFISIIFIAFIVISCSTPEGRRELVTPLGNSIWRQHSNNDDIGEVFVLVDKDSLLVVVQVTEDGKIRKIDRLPYKMIEDNNE